MNGLFIKTITIFEVVKVLFLPDIGTFSYSVSNKSNRFLIGLTFDAQLLTIWKISRKLWKCQYYFEDIFATNAQIYIKFTTKEIHK